VTLVRLYSPQSPLDDPHAIGDSTSPTGLVLDGEEVIGYESKVVASPGGHDGLRFTLGVCNDQGSGGETLCSPVTHLERSVDPNRRSPRS